jgi:hypothetical protein
MIILTDSQLDFNRKLLGEFASQLNKQIKSKSGIILKDVKSQLRVFFNNSRHYQSMINGTDESNLRAHFGFTKSQEASRVDPIIDKFIGSLFTTFKPYNGRLGGEFAVMGIADDFNDVLSMSEAFVINKGEALPWLEWLLESGDSFVVQDAAIEFGPGGRSGQAIMREPGKWKVPPEYAGTNDNNWVTEVLDVFLASGQLEAIIERHINAS